MAKIPPLTRIRTDDFRDVPEEVKPVVDQLMYAINPFVTATRNALAKRLTWANFASLKRTIRVRSTSFPLSVNMRELPGTPDGVFVLQCYDATDRAPALAPRIAWVQDGVTIRITTMSDLVVDHEYEVTLLVTAQ
jgi:hypothetical protein